MNPKINTVVAKAILNQVDEEMKLQDQSQIKMIEKKIADSVRFRKLKALRIQAEKISKQADKIEKSIEQNPPRGFLVDVYTDTSIRVRAREYKVSIGYITSHIIILGSEGKSIDEIKKIIKAKYYKH